MLDHWLTSYLSFWFLLAEIKMVENLSTLFHHERAFVGVCWYVRVLLENKIIWHKHTKNLQVTRSKSTYKTTQNKNRLTETKLVKKQYMLFQYQEKKCIGIYHFNDFNLCINSQMVKESCKILLHLYAVVLQLGHSENPGLAMLPYLKQGNISTLAQN